MWRGWKLWLSNYERQANSGRDAGVGLHLPLLSRRGRETRRPDRSADPPLSRRRSRAPRPTIARHSLVCSSSTVSSFSARPSCVLEGTWAAWASAWQSRSGRHCRSCGPSFVGPLIGAKLTAHFRVGSPAEPDSPTDTRLPVRSWNAEGTAATGDRIAVAPFGPPRQSRGVGRPARRSPEPRPSCRSWGCGPCGGRTLSCRRGTTA